MYGELRWSCRWMFCRLANRTEMDTADRQPHDLFCVHCGRAQNAMAVLRSGLAPLLIDTDEDAYRRRIYRGLTEDDVALP